MSDKPGGDRRRAGQATRSPFSLLEQMPALVILERIPVPVVAIGQDGAILFANAAFAAMLGQTPKALQSLKFHQVFHNLPLDESDPVALLRAYADEVVELLHRDGSLVLARMSKSAMTRRDDPVALATFCDLTEQLWLDGR